MQLAYEYRVFASRQLLVHVCPSQADQTAASNRTDLPTHAHRDSVTVALRRYQIRQTSPSVSGKPLRPRVSRVGDGCAPLVGCDAS